jgi:hypothetical protein
LLSKKYEKEIKKRENILEDIIERYHTDRCTPKGTVWSALNSVTESVEYGRLGGRFNGNDHERNSRRFESSLYGKGDEIKQLAYEKAVAVLN